VNELQLKEKAEELTPLSDPAEAANLLGLVAEAERRLDDIKSQIKVAMLQILTNQPNQSFTHGVIRYYIGTKKSTKPTALKAVAEAVLTATGGDLDGFTQCLSTNAFKPGQCREVLGQATWDTVFRVEEELEVREGKPERVKKLIAVDTRFMD
jgi:hypothetical protein